MDIDDLIDNVEARRFWETVYLASLDRAHHEANPNVPWSHRAAEIADHAVERWKERFAGKNKE